MSPEMRQALKQAVDARVRLREAPSMNRTHCSGCGCVNEERTIGCKPCRNRHSARRTRARAA